MSDTRFRSLPADAFPFTVEFMAGAVVLETVTVSGPGVLNVPKHAMATHVRVTYATGETVTAPCEHPQ